MLKIDQIKKFHEQGFLMLGNLFSNEEINRINGELVLLSALDTPKKIFEKNGSMRSFFAPHEESSILDGVGKLNRLVESVEQLLDNEIYIHQTKLNTKQALVGDWWDWHQDFAYWHLEDGMPGSNVLTAMIFLDDVNEFNGPLLLLPGSNKAGLVDVSPNLEMVDANNDWFNSYQSSTTYMSDVTANLKYTLKRQTLLKWLNKSNIFSAKAPAGSVLIFDGLVFHASSNNLSPWNRNTYLITYNSIENTLPNVSCPRPNFLANRDFSPIVDLIDTFID